MLMEAESLHHHIVLLGIHFLNTDILYNNIEIHNTYRS